MTVAELIEELQKYQPHHTVIIEYPDRSEPRVYGYVSEYASVSGVAADSGPSVVLDATGGVQ